MWGRVLTVPKPPQDQKTSFYESTSCVIGGSQDNGFVEVSEPQFVKRRLRAAGLTDPVAARKPLLRKRGFPGHEAPPVHGWNWRKALWTDESKLEIFGSSRSVSVRRRVGEGRFLSVLHMEEEAWWSEALFWIQSRRPWTKTATTASCSAMQCPLVDP